MEDECGDVRPDGIVVPLQLAGPEAAATGEPRWWVWVWTLVGRGASPAGRPVAGVLSGGVTELAASTSVVNAGHSNTLVDMVGVGVGGTKANGSGTGGQQQF